MEAQVLVVDDERSIRETLKNILKEEGYRVSTAESIKTMKEKVEREYFHCVLLDLWLPDGNGLDYIAYLKEKLPGSALLVITGHGKTEHAVRAIKEGAYYFLESSFSIDRLLTTIELLQRTLKVKKREEEDPILGNSNKCSQVKGNSFRRWQVGTDVLLIGESGTGKSVGQKASQPIRKVRGTLHRHKLCRFA
ncbi:MAG: response regulator [Aquificaceae bacterium]